jgi:SAM-dependent methyltransferase
MPDLKARLAELSPAKRAALEKILRDRSSASQPGTATGVQPAESPQTSIGSDLLLAVDETVSDSLTRKARWKRFYDTVSSQLDGNVFGQFSFFLNYGYVPDGQPEFSAVELPEHYINKNSVKLVLELIQDCPVDGKRILDVGCGRGGTLYVLKTFFEPLRLEGLDLSSAAIDFCRNAHRDANLSFHEGDAENLPFEDESFEVVTNVESSHTYPNIHRFYTEVARVLAAGGYFLYTDLLAPAQVIDSIRYLRSLGFELERERDITANVLRSCDEIAGTRVQAFQSPSDGEMVENFLATPNSLVYQEMRAGRLSYRMLKLKKSQ